MAALLDISTASYWDLESHDEDMFMVTSLQQVLLLCRTLNLAPNQLFAEEYRKEQEAISLAGVVAKIKSHVEAQRIELSEFGDRVGWDIGKMLDRPEERFNVDALRDLCGEIGVNWVAVLSETIHPETSRGSGDGVNPSSR